MNKILPRLFIGTGFLAAGLFLWNGLSGKKTKSRSQPVLSVTALNKKMQRVAAGDERCMVKGFCVKKEDENGRPFLFLQDDPDSAHLILPVKCFFRKDAESQLTALELQSELVLTGRAVYNGRDIRIEDAAIISQNSPQIETKR